MTTRLCVNMIVRNEAPIIARALESVAAEIAHWVICDTGSTDGTQQIIRNFFAERGIPGELFEHPFDGFDRARNRALDCARQSEGAFDYLLLMDADMQLHVTDPSFRDGLTAAAYDVLQKAGISYWNRRLLRRDNPAVYRGITHEYLDVTGGAERLTGLWFEDQADGANRPGKFDRDIQLLLGGLEAEPDNGRYVYYLAQSYRDAGAFEKAAEAYLRRFEMGGWEEERWSALLNAARCRLQLGDEAGFVETEGRAFSLRPQRAEPLHDLAIFYRQRQRYEEAMACCELASRIPYPVADRLFIEDYVYNVGVWQEMSIAGFYCAEPARKTRGRLACNALSLDRSIPPAARKKARENLAYYAKPANELLPSWQGWQVPWSPPDGRHATNPSIAVRDGIYWLVVRTVNYQTKDGIEYTKPDDEPYQTHNILMQLGDDLQPAATREILPPIDLPKPRFNRVLGFEDLRLFSWRGGLWATSTTRQLNDQGWCDIVLSRLEMSVKDEVRIADWRVLSAEGVRRHQKNWMPLVDGDRLRFIYPSDPVWIVDETGATLGETIPNAALEHLRGGSQAIPFDGGRLALTHEVSPIDGSRVYLHRFVWYDADNRLTRFSGAFMLNRRGIEFAAGLAMHRDGERLIVSYGIGDAEAWLATVLASDVRRAIELAPGSKSA